MKGKGGGTKERKTFQKMAKGGHRRRRKRGKGRKKKGGGGRGMRRSRGNASTKEESTEKETAVQRVFNNVSLTDMIMSFYFVAKGGVTNISAFAMASRYWYSCHEDFVRRSPDTLLCAWFESCCDRRGLFVFNRTRRAEELYDLLGRTQDCDSPVTYLLRGCRAKCFDTENSVQNSVQNSIQCDNSNVHVMSLLNIFSTPSLRENKTVLSFARHMMSQWMYLSIGDWKVEMRTKTFKKNLIEMCVGWEKAKRGGCRPSGAALSRAKALVSLAMAFEASNVSEVQRIVKKLKL